MGMLKLEDGTFVEIAEESISEVSLNEWRENGFVTKAQNLVIANDNDLKNLTADLSNFERIVVEFPTFRDGRAYSQVRRLRDQFNYSGDIVARGDVGCDQVLFMIRSGINVFDVSANVSQSFEAASREFSLFYQSAADNVEALWQLRRKEAIAA